MNTDIQIFENPEFGQIRVSISNDKEWFCLSDVCKALDIGNPSQLKARLQQRGLITNDTPTYNQHGTMVIQKMTYIDEANLYRCIFQSRKQEAEQFQSWVFDVVLPQIRKTGGYIPVSDVDTRESILRKALNIYDATVQIKDDIIHTLLPKAQYAEQVLLSPTCYTMTQVAKSLSMTVLELTHELLRRHIIYRQSGTYMLYAPFLKQGYEAYRTKLGENIFGATASTDTYLVWTEKGREFVRRCLS